MNLASKYRPKTFEDMTEQSVVVDIVKRMCENEDLNVRTFLFTGPAGCGKAQPLTSSVLTTSGYIKMCDVKVGTEVYTSYGNIAKVSGIYPQGVLPVYKLTFTDGGNEFYAEVADNHLNCVYLHINHKLIYLHSIDTLNLKMLFDAGVEILIDNPVDYLDYSSNEFIQNVSHTILPSIKYRALKSIERIEDKQCQCIMIDHEDHTYITDDWIPTHNTTLCRIAANVLNDGKGDPIEIDAASNSGVESMRNIMEQAKTYPIGSKWKIFIIDECHAFSAAAWQAALKVLEEVPAKTIFFFATTNPEKIPATIISRVQRFQLSKISLDGIQSRLKYIIDCENNAGSDITYEDSAISFIAKMANGGMRDSITLLEKAIASDKHITSVSLIQSLGLPNYDDFFQLLQAFASKNNAKIAEIVDKVYNSGVNYVRWMLDFHSFVVNVMKYIYLKDINKTMIPSHYEEKLSKYGVAHSVICLKLSNKLIKLNQELRYSQYQQELTLTYLCSVPNKNQ